jgi:hypothetical protein
MDDYGHVWICGMYSDVNAKPAQIYVVEDFETGACKNVGEWKLPDEETDAAGRIDYWDVVGDITGAEANAVCMGAVGTTAAGEKLCLYRWELAQGATEWVANEDDFAGYVSNTDLAETYPADQVTWGQSSATVKIVAEEGHAGSMFYVDGFTTCPSLYLTSLTMDQSFASAPDLAPAVGCNGVNEFVLSGDGTEKPYIAYVEAQYNVSPGCRVNIAQLGEGMSFEGMRLLWSVPEAGLGEVSDGGTRVHNIAIAKQTDEAGKEAAANAEKAAKSNKQSRANGNRSAGQTLDESTRNKMGDAEQAEWENFADIYKARKDAIFSEDHLKAAMAKREAERLDIRRKKEEEAFLPPQS